MSEKLFNYFGYSKNNLLKARRRNLSHEKGIRLYDVRNPENLNKPAKPRRRAFSGAKGGRLYGSWNPANLSADAEIYRDLRTLRARSRDLGRNDGYVKKFFRMATTNVIGQDGITLQSQALTTGKKPDEVAREKIEGGWKDYNKKGNFDVTGMYSGVDSASLAVKSMARDGEVLIRFVNNYDNSHRFAIQLIEADHLDENHHDILSNGNIINMGVEKNRWGRPEAYHLFQTHPGNARFGGMSYGKKERVPADEIIHLFMPDRISQGRGIPWVHAALLRLENLGAYEEAEIIAARINSMKGGFYTTPDGQYQGDDEENNEPVKSLEPGTFEALPPGYSFTPFDPKHPTTAFDPFVKATLRGVSSAVDVSYNYLSNDLTGVNYSSIRAGVLDERDVWRFVQGYMIRHFYTAIFEKWLNMALLTKKVNLPFNPERFSVAKWDPRGWKWVDPQKDVNAAIMARKHGFTTSTAIAAESGKSFEDNIKRIAHENEIMKKNDITLEQIL